MVEFREPVKLKVHSNIGASLAFGHRSHLAEHGATFNGFSFTTTSTSYDTSTWSTAAHVVIGFNTLLKDLEAKGILVKG